MHTFRQPHRLRAQARYPFLLPLVMLAYNVWEYRSWRFGLWSMPFGMLATPVCLLALAGLASELDQHRRRVVVAADGLHTRRLFHSAFVGWDDVRDVQVRRHWDGDHLVVATPQGTVRLDAPHMLIRSGAARRQFEATAGELQRVIAEQVFMRYAHER